MSDVLQIMAMEDEKALCGSRALAGFPTIVLASQPHPINGPSKNEGASVSLPNPDLHRMLYGPSFESALEPKWWDIAGDAGSSQSILVGSFPESPEDLRSTQDIQRLPC